MLPASGAQAGVVLTTLYSFTGGSDGEAQALIESRLKAPNEAK